MNFLLDVHLSKGLARMLEADGHVCRLVVEVGNPKMDDIDILRLALENGEVILTHDLDFGTLLAFSKESKSSGSKKSIIKSSTSSYQITGKRLKNH